LLGIALRCSRLMFHLVVAAIVFDRRYRVRPSSSRRDGLARASVLVRFRDCGIPVVPSYSAPLGARSSLLWRNGWECGIRFLEQRAAQPAPAGWYLAGNVEAHLISVARILLFARPVEIAGILRNRSASLDARAFSR
jgi:hypothetical protein